MNTDRLKDFSGTTTSGVICEDQRRGVRRFVREKTSFHRRDAEYFREKDTRRLAAPLPPSSGLLESSILHIFPAKIFMNKDL